MPVWFPGSHEDFFSRGILSSRAIYVDLPSLTPIGQYCRMNSLMKRAATAALLLYSTNSVEAQEISSSPTTTCATILAPSYTPPVVADGWSAQLVATGLKRPRGIKVDSKGGLLVIEAGTGLTHLTLQDNGGTCVSVKSSTTVIDDENVSIPLYSGHKQRTDHCPSSTMASSFPKMARRSTSPPRRTSTATTTTPRPKP